MKMLSPATYYVIYFLLLMQTWIFTTTDENLNKSYNDIRSIHQHIDDDNDGEINLSESADYMATELQAPNEKRQSQFHNNDNNISVDDLWKKWMESPVYSWSVDDVVHWLKNTAKLPQYEATFRANKVTGKNMPRLATAKAKYVQQELKVASAIDRKKIYLTASALILFGDTDEKPHQKNEKPIDKNFLAIKAIHSHLDDNLDGEINVDESVDFVHGELKGKSTTRHTSFHSNDDLISVDDLWKSWEYSEVYNWTNEEVIKWLKGMVGLPQYENIFREKKVDGKFLPRLATDKSSFVQKELGITNSSHRKKMYLRASDIILFGAHSSHTTNFFSDTIVLLTVLIASLLCFYAFHQKSLSTKQIEQLTSDMEFLKHAEQQLRELQESEGSTVQLRGEIEAAKKEYQRLEVENSKHEEEKTKVQRLEQEVQFLTSELAKAKKEIKYNEVRSPVALQNLLGLTYKKEVHHFHQRKQQALSQMQEAKEACEKVNKTRRAVFGSLRLAHGQSIDVVDQKILNAKTSLAEVTKDLQERQNRWQQIECICNFSIVNDENNLTSNTMKLSDSLLFGSKGLEVYDSQFLAFSENEQLDQLDSEVEAITKRKFARTSTESSSSSENSFSKNAHSESQKQSSPAQISKNVKSKSSPIQLDNTVEVKSKTSYDSLSLGGRNSISSSDTTIHKSSTFANLDDVKHTNPLKKRNKTVEYSHTRTNTDPNVNKLPEDNGASPKAPRPTSMTEKDIKKKKKILSIGRLTNTS